MKVKPFTLITIVNNTILTHSSIQHYFIHYIDLFLLYLTCICNNVSAVNFMEFYFWCLSCSSPSTRLYMFFLGGTCDIQISSN